MHEHWPPGTDRPWRSNPIRAGFQKPCPCAASHSQLWLIWSPPPHWYTRALAAELYCGQVPRGDRALHRPPEKCGAPPGDCARTTTRKGGNKVKCSRHAPSECSRIHPLGGSSLWPFEHSWVGSFFPLHLLPARAMTREKEERRTCCRTGGFHPFLPGRINARSMRPSSAPLTSGMQSLDRGGRANCSSILQSDSEFLCIHRSRQPCTSLPSCPSGWSSSRTPCRLRTPTAP